MRKILAIAALACSSNVIARDLPKSELSVGGIAPGVTEAFVLRRLGQPLQRLETGEGTELRYPGLRIFVELLEQAAASAKTRRVLGVHATASHACTPRGVCPGRAVFAAQRLYGPGERTVRESGPVVEYYVESNSCWLQLSVPKGVIRSVAVVCQP